jgi:hypothetical protein
MTSPINTQGAGEFAWTGAEVLERCHVAASGHFLDTPCRLQGTNQNKAILAPPSHQKVQQPVYSVVQIHIRRSSRHSRHKLPRGRPREGMTCLVVVNGIRLCLDNHAPATIPNQLAADHLPRTSHGIALEKIRRHVHAAHSVRSRQKCSIFCLCKSARRAPTTWRAIVPHGPNFHHGRRGMTDRHLSTKNRPENAALGRRFAAEEWAMPEDGPPMESGLICER